MRISILSQIVLVCLFTILLSDLTIVQSYTKWTTTERTNYTGTCATTCIPDVCISNETSEKFISCPERKYVYMEISKDSSLKGRGLSRECPRYAASTVLSSDLGCYKKDHREVKEEYGHNYFHTCFSPAIPAGIGSLSLGNLQSVHAEAQAATTSNSSEAGLIFVIGRLGANYSRRCVHYLVGAYKSRFWQTSSISLTGKEVKLTTVLWISGGVFMALVLGLAIITICCTRGKCQRNTQERSPISIPRSYPVFSFINSKISQISFKLNFIIDDDIVAWLRMQKRNIQVLAFPVAKTPQRPEARVCPFTNQGAASSREESRPLLSPEYSPTSYSAVDNQSGGTDNFVERFAGQNRSHPIDVQGYTEYLRTAPTLDPSSITEDRSHWEDLN